MSKPLKWLRPEYKGREDELVNVAAAAALVGVHRSSVTNWAKRHANFPKVALLVGLGAGRAKYVPRDEFLTFAREQLANPGTGRKTGPHRPAAVIRAEEIAHRERQIERLSKLAKRQAETLANTRRALARHRAGLQHAQQRLAAEVAAVRQLEETAGDRGRAVPKNS
ncbi:hypothetical protein [Streptomyces sp. NPDC001680]